jgi:hypothetical protein
LFQNIDKDGVIGTRKVPSPIDVWRIPEVEKVVLRCTRLGLPVGIAGMKFHRLGAKLVRSGKFCDFTLVIRGRYQHKKNKIYGMLLW